MSSPIYTTRAVPTGIPSLSGGLNSNASGISVQNNESTDCQNVDYDIFGSVLSRNGYTRLNTSAFNSGATWNSLHWFELSSDTDYIIGTCGNKLAKMDVLDGTWDDITGAVTITAGNNNHMRWKTFLDTAIGTNNVNLPIKWTGTGNASVLGGIAGGGVAPTITKVKYLEIFNAYTILANVTSSGVVQKNRVYWSTINTIETFDAADFNDVDKNDGTEITGLKVLGDKLVIFKERSIHIALFTGDADIPFQFVKTPSHVGCVSGDSIQLISNGLKFLSHDGLYYFDGSNSTKISDKITSTLDLFSKSRFANVQSVYQKEKNKYWASFTTNGNVTNDRGITWDTINNAYSFYKGHNANCFAIVNTAGEERVYFGDYSGFVYRADTGINDNPSGIATAIDSYWYSKWMNFDDLVDKKGIPSVYIYYQISSSTLTFAYSYDFESTDTYTQTFSMATSSAVYGTAIFDLDTYAATGGAIKRRDLTGRGTVIRFKFANATIDEYFRIDGLGILAYLETYK